MNDKMRIYDIKRSINRLNEILLLYAGGADIIISTMSAAAGLSQFADFNKNLKAASKHLEEALDNIEEAINEIENLLQS